MSTLSTDFFPMADGFLSIENDDMIRGIEIIERVEGLASEKGLSVPKKPKDAFRKVRERSTLPSLATLSECAVALGTSVAYLIGETDDKTPSAPLRSAETNRDSQVIDFDLISSLDTGEGVLTVVEADGKVRYLLTPHQLMAMKHLVSEVLGDMKLSASSSS